MLLLFKLLPKKNYPDKEKVNTASYRIMLFYSFPGLFHFFAPMNIIKN
jgi:hypothetical protein